MINIVCVLRAGGKVGYDASWVEKLRNNIFRNVTIPYRFICLSDCDVPCERIPIDDIGAGYWSKLQLFKKDQFTGPVLYFDLDTLICNNIDELIMRLLNQKSFVMWKDTTYNISSSAIMYWNGDYSNIYDTYIKDTNYYETRYSTKNQGPERLVGDQAVISTTIDHCFINDFCPKDWIHVASKNDFTKDLSNVRILIFRKNNSKPSTLVDHALVKTHWK